MGEPARLQLKVRHYEVDEYGHVNHANYVHYLEAGRVEALDSVGLSLSEMRRQGYLIVAAELFLTWIRELRRVRSVWAQEIRGVKNRRCLVTAEVTGAFLTEDGRPARVPEPFLEKLAALHMPEVAHAPVRHEAPEP